MERTIKDNTEYINYFWGSINNAELNIFNINEALNKTINKVIDDYY